MGDALALTEAAALTRWTRACYSRKNRLSVMRSVCVVSMSLDSASGIRFFNPSGVARDGAFRMTDNTFHIYEYNSDTGAFIQEIAITEIFKV